MKQLLNRLIRFITYWLWYKWRPHKPTSYITVGSYDLNTIFHGLNGEILAVITVAVIEPNQYSTLAAIYCRLTKNTKLFNNTYTIDAIMTHPVFLSNNAMQFTADISAGQLRARASGTPANSNFYTHLALK